MGGNSLYDWTLTRDNAGRITRRVENIQGSAITWDYQYDQLGRLMEVQQNGSIVESYTYDANGNRLTETNVLRGVSNQTYTYSNEDNIITAGTDTYQFDKDGFLTGKTTATGTTTFSYSSRGELLNAMLSDGREISYDHDPLGRRIVKRINGTITEKYLWAGRIKLFAIFDANDTLIMRFNYAGGRMPVSMTKNGTTYYLLYDQVGSLRAVSDTSGNIVKQIAYDSFGNIINDSNLTFDVPFGFAGGLHDYDTGLVRFGFRDYDPIIGKWTAKDPIDFAGGDVNLFGYVKNNPVNWIDRWGLIFEYHIGTGQLWHFPPEGGAAEYVGEGYSGSGDGLNNPLYQLEPFVGPIPEGEWRIGPPYPSPLGKPTFVLTPKPGTDDFGRDKFRIHADNDCKCFSASGGCIVLSPEARRYIAESGDPDLLVVP